MVKTKYLSVLSCILIIFLIANVSATLDDAIFGFGKEMALTQIGSINPDIGKVINFAMCPKCVADNALMGVVKDVLPGATDIYSTISNPTAAAQKLAKQQIITALKEKMDDKQKIAFDNLVKIQPYIQEAFKENPTAKEGQEKGTVEMKDKDGNTVVMDPDGNIFAKIPEGFEIIESTQGKEFLIIQNTAGSEKSTLEIKGNKFTLSRNSKISFSEKDGLTNFKLDGSGNLNLNGKVINNVKDASIRVDKENQIEFADFVSTKEENYKFTYNSEEFEFRSNTNSHIIFDPKNKKISASNSELNYKNQLISGDFDATLNEKGIKEISLGKNAIYLDRENGLRYSSKEKYNIYFDGRDVSSEKNALSILKKEEKVQVNAKGKIKIHNFEKNIIYEGLNEEAYTHYMDKSSIFSKTNEDAVFDIKNGDAVINNGVHEVKFEKGKSYISKKNLLKDSKDAESFTFKYTQEGKDSSYTRINEKSRNLEVVSFKEEGKKITVISSFKDFEAKQKKMSGDLLITYLTDELGRISSKIESEKSSGENAPSDLIKTRDALRIVLDYPDVNALLAKENYDGAIDMLKKKLNLIEDSEVKANMHLHIAGIYQTKAYYQTDPDLKKETYENAIKFYELGKNDANTFKDASFGLAALHCQNKDYNNALKEYDSLIQNSGDNKIKSKAYINKAEIYFDTNKPRDALQAINSAVKENPADTTLLEKKNMEIALLYKISDSLDKESSSRANQLEEYRGLNEDFWSASLRTTVIQLTESDKDVTTKTNSIQEQIDSQKIGISVIQELISKGYKFEDIESISEMKDSGKKTIREVFRLSNTDGDKIKIDKMVTGMYDAFKNQDVQNVFSGGKVEFNFEKGKGYFDYNPPQDYEFLRIVNTETVAPFLLPFTGAAKLLMMPVNFIKGTSLGLKATGAASSIKSLPGIKTIVNFLGKEVTSPVFPKAAEVVVQGGAGIGKDIAAGTIAGTVLPGSEPVIDLFFSGVNNKKKIVEEMMIRDELNKVLEIGKYEDGLLKVFKNQHGLESLAKSPDIIPYVSTENVVKPTKIGRTFTLEDGRPVYEVEYPFGTEYFDGLSETMENAKKKGLITSLGDGTNAYTTLPKKTESIIFRTADPNSANTKIDPVRSFKEDLDKITVPDDFPNSEDEIAKAINEMGGSTTYNRKLDELGWESNSYLKGESAKELYIVKNNIKPPNTDYAYLGASDTFLNLVREKGLSSSTLKKISSGMGELTYAGDIGYARAFTDAIEGNSLIFRWKLKNPAPKSTLFSPKTRPINPNLIEYSTDQGRIWKKLSETDSRIPYYVDGKKVVGVTTSAEQFTGLTLGLRHDNEYYPSRIVYSLNPDIQNSIKAAFTGMTK